MKAVTKMIWACFVVLVLAGCHKEEPVVGGEMPTIVWTEYINEHNYYDDYYDYSDSLIFDYPEGTRVVAHYSDNSMAFFGNHPYREGLTCIGNRFADGGSLDGYSLEIPESIIVRTNSESGEWYFDGHAGSIDTLPVVAVRGGSFDHRLNSVTFPSSFFDESSGFHGIEERAFAGCTSLHTVTILPGIETLPFGAFRNLFDNELGWCSESVSVILPEGLKTIGEGAFLNCTSLVNVVFPESLETIGYGAFAGCTSLTSVVFPEGIHTIENDAFDGCSSLMSIVLPNDIWSLGDAAFRGCSSLSTITILKVSETISENAFSGRFNDVSSTLSLIISDGITTICDKAFKGCPMLKSISFPSSIQKVASDAFYGCSSLQEVTIRAGMDAVPEGAYDGVFKKENGFTSSSATLLFGEGYRFIGKRAFRDCSLFSNVVFPSELEEVSMAAFSRCSSLTELVFPEGFKTIQGGYYNEHWEYVVEGGAFNGCSSLTNVVLPEGLESIGEWAFGGCSSLTEIVIPKSVWRISAGAFNGCSSLANVVFSEGLQEIAGGYEDMDSWFNYDITGTFSGCSSLTNIVFPADLEELGVGSFWGCPSLVTCTSYAIVPPRVRPVTSWGVVFDDQFNLGEGGYMYIPDPTPLQAIYVPRRSVEAYKAADGWRNYADIIYPIE